jgi:hypothetical protein
MVNTNPVLTFRYQADKKIYDMSYLKRMIARLSFLIFIVTILTVNYGCQPRQTFLKDKTYCITRLWYQISKTANPDKLFYTVNIPDSALFFDLISNVNRFKFKFSGSIFDIDTIKILNYSAGADIRDSSLIIGNVCSNLKTYPKAKLDSIIRETKSNIYIEVRDTITNQKFLFKSCHDSISHTSYRWTKEIPNWLFFRD